MKKKLPIFLLIVLGWTLGYSQVRKTVTGTVKDAQGEVMPGVSVIEKGTTNGTQTRVDGTFSLNVASNAVLRFTFLGFAAKEVSATNSTTMQVTLATDENTLNEVVVVGFGMASEKRKLAYSVQDVKGEELTRANEPNIANALQGKVAGVVINQGSGGPQSSSRIRIRGNSSLRPNTQPLVVVDGVLIQPGVTGGDSWGGNPEDFGNVMKNLNPDDYESISVLKGSAASSLYGSLAQNGVLLITTKKGKATQGLGISYNLTNSYEDAYKTVATQNEFGAGITETFPLAPDGVPTIDQANYIWSFGPRFNGQQVRDLDGRMIGWNANPDNVLDVYRTGVYTNANLAVQGGSDRGTFRISYTNMGSASVLPNNKLERNAIDLRASQKLGKIFNVDAGVNYTTSKGVNPAFQGNNINPVFGLVYFTPRNFDVNYWKTRYEDTQLGGRATGATKDPYNQSNLFWNLYRRDTRQNENNLRANVDVTTTITPWLNLLVRGNISSVGYDNETKNIGSDVGYAGGNYSIGQASDRSHRLQAVLNLTRALNDNFDLNLSLGGENSRNFGRRYSTSLTNGGLKVPGGFYIGNSVNAAETRGGQDGGRRIDAVYAFGDISFKDMLSLNFSVRNDWSSTLTYPDGRGNNSYTYPAVGMAWVFSDLVKNSAFNFLSFGKLRGSFGYTGLDTDPYRTSEGKYIFQSNFRADNGVVYPRYGFANNTLGNQNLKNELTKEIELGADLRFFNDRLGLDVSYYKKNTTNQILSLAVPSESGINTKLINAGNIQNSGIEVLLNATPIQSKNFSWNTSINFAANRNKVLELADGVTSYDLDLAFGADVRSVAIAGEQYGTILSGYSYGTFQAKDASGKPIDHPNNGQKALKANGSYWRTQDIGQGQKDLGSMMEKFTTSTINNFSYKGVSLNFQLDAKIGGKMASATHQYGSTAGTLESTLPGRPGFGGLPIKNAAGVVTSNDGIIPEGVFNTGTVIAGQDVSGMTFAEAVSKGITQPVSARLYYARLTQWSTGIREYSVFENSWVAVREVSVGYNLPKNLVSKIKMNNMRVSLTARNLGYLYTTTPDDINPEGLFSNRAGTFAEYGGLPYIRTLGFSLRGDL